MRIEVIVQTDETEQEVYGFNLFDLTAVFVAWHRQVKPKGKRKWTITEFWDSYARSDRKISPMPKLPECVRAEAALKIAELIKVKTWTEWKP